MLQPKDFPQTKLERNDDDDDDNDDNNNNNVDRYGLDGPGIKS
jgi:hypothetical protein